MGCMSLKRSCLGAQKSLTRDLGGRVCFAQNGKSLGLEFRDVSKRAAGAFDVFLPGLGLRTPGGMTGQQTSFFCLQNHYWRMIAIDTGYNSIGVPILSGIPWINSIPGIGGDCELPAPLLKC